MRSAWELGEVAVGKAAASMRMYMPQRRPAGRVGAAGVLGGNMGMDAVQRLH